MMEALKKLIALGCLLACVNGAIAADKPNILFIAIDDLRPELGCYGSEIAVTPNLDGLAKGGLLFNRAYCQQAICRPSRASLMTGTRPETTGLFHNYVSLRELQPDILTLPQLHFQLVGARRSFWREIEAVGFAQPLAWLPFVQPVSSRRTTLAAQNGAIGRRHDEFIL